MNADNLTLELWLPERPDYWSYYIDLERVWNSASLLDWIFQVHGHDFGQCSTSVMEDLLDALHAIFDPQAHLCSAAMDKELPAGFLHERIQQSA